MRAQLRAALTAAIKARDPVAVSALRSGLAAIANAEAVDAASMQPSITDESEFAGAVLGLGAGEVARRELSEADVRAILRTEVSDRTGAADDYERLGQPEHAARLRAEAEFLNKHLL